MRQRRLRGRHGRLPPHAVCVDAVGGIGVEVAGVPRHAHLAALVVLDVLHARQHRSRIAEVAEPLDALRVDVEVHAGAVVRPGQQDAVRAVRARAQAAVAARAGGPRPVRAAPSHWRRGVAREPLSPGDQGEQLEAAVGGQQSPGSIAHEDRRRRIQVQAGAPAGRNAPRGQVVRRHRRAEDPPRVRPAEIRAAQAIGNRRHRELVEHPARQRRAVRQETQRGHATRQHVMRVDVPIGAPMIVPLDVGAGRPVRGEERIALIARRVTQGHRPGQGSRRADPRGADVVAPERVRLPRHDRAAGAVRGDRRLILDAQRRVEVDAARQESERDRPRGSDARHVRVVVAPAVGLGPRDERAAESVSADLRTVLVTGAEGEVHAVGGPAGRERARRGVATGVDGRVAGAVVVPRHDGAAGAVGDHHLAALIAGKRAHRQAVGRPGGIERTGARDVGHVQIDARAPEVALVLPADEHAARPVGGRRRVVLVARQETHRQVHVLHPGPCSGAGMRQDEDQQQRQRDSCEQQGTHRAPRGVAVGSPAGGVVAPDARWAGCRALTLPNAEWALERTAEPPPRASGRAGRGRGRGSTFSRPAARRRAPCSASPAATARFPRPGAGRRGTRSPPPAPPPVARSTPYPGCARGRASDAG